MTPHKLFAEVTERSLAHRIAGALQDLLEPPPDALSIFEERSEDGKLLWRVEAYFADDRAPAEVQQTLSDLIGEPIPDFRAAEVPNLNWVALSQAALPPVVAHRFIVHGSHDRGRVPQGPNAILIDAGEAFGTAHHATTYGCLKAIDRLARQGSFGRILDLGCGSGILAIAAARCWPDATVFGVDIDAQSIAVARGNARANGEGGRLTLRAGNGLREPVIRRAAPYDLIIANILAGPLISLAREVRHAAAPGATIVLSGLLVREAEQVIAAYLAQRFALRTHRRYEGWSTLVLVKRS
jgi:ribosomal protein L11 methyltransferase